MSQRPINQPIDRPIKSIGSDGPQPIKRPIAAHRRPIKETLGLIGRSKASRARAEVVLFSNKQPVRTSNLFYSIWAEASLSKLAQLQTTLSKDMG